MKMLTFILNMFYTGFGGVNGKKLQFLHTSNEISIILKNIVEIVRKYIDFVKKSHFSREI